MTKEHLKNRFKELIDANPPLKEIEELFNKALDSGALDYEKEFEQDYRLAKIIYHAILCTMVDQWVPYDKANKDESTNLQLFL